jgi:hypothetical protein
MFTYYGTDEECIHIIAPVGTTYISRTTLWRPWIRAGAGSKGYIGIRLSGAFQPLLFNPTIVDFSDPTGVGIQVEGGVAGSSIGWDIVKCNLANNMVGIRATGGAISWLATEGVISSGVISLPATDVAARGILTDDCAVLRIKEMAINSAVVGATLSKGIYINNVNAKTVGITIEACNIEQVDTCIEIDVDVQNVSISNITPSGVNHVIVDNSGMAKIDVGRTAGYYDNGGHYEGYLSLGKDLYFRPGHITTDGYYPKTIQTNFVHNKIYGFNRLAHGSPPITEYFEIRIGQPIYANSTKGWWQRIHTGECGHIKLPAGGLTSSKYLCNAISNDRCAILLMPFNAAAAAIVASVYVEGLWTDPVTPTDVYFKLKHPASAGTEEFYFIVVNRDIDQDNIITGIAV